MMTLKVRLKEGKKNYVMAVLTVDDHWHADGDAVCNSESTGRVGGGHGYFWSVS